MPRQQDAYRRFCATAPPDLPVFMEHWYLDAVCGPEHWDAAVVERGGRVMAVWPYVLKRKWGISQIVMPPLARFQGPWLQAEYRNPRKEISLLKDLLEQLPRVFRYEQDWNHSATNWLPCYWKGYRQTVRYTYAVDLSDLEAAWNNMEPDYRKQKIPRARQQVQVQPGGTLADFQRLHDMSYARQGMPSPVSQALLEHLDAALATHGRREIFTATAPDTGAIHAAAYVVYDRHTAWYLMAGEDPGLRHSGAGILLAWEAVAWAAATGQLRLFDFAGSMVPAIERVRRQFGAEQRMYFRVWKGGYI